MLDDCITSKISSELVFPTSAEPSTCVRSSVSRDRADAALGSSVLKLDLRTRQFGDNGFGHDAVQSGQPTWRKYGKLKTIRQTFEIN